MRSDFVPTARVDSAAVWRALEEVPGQAAVEAGWRGLVGDAFAVMRDTLLERGPGRAARVPCPRGCGCEHRVVEHGAGDLTAVCACDSWGCDDLALREEETVIWQLSWSRLARGLCRAFELEPQTAGFELPGTRQIGSWSVSAAPVVLSVQSNGAAYREAAAELAARLRRPFILLLPTRRRLNANALEVLAHCGAAEFDLASNLRLSPPALLQCVCPPGRLFSRFTPEPAAADQELAQRAFALVRQLDAEQPLKPPSVLTTFRLYCMEGRSTGEIAGQFRCSRATIVSRLQTIEQRVGMPPASLRQYSAHLAGIEETLAHPAARRIRARDLIDGEPEEG